MTNIKPKTIEELILANFIDVEKSLVNKPRIKPKKEPPYPGNK